MDPDVTVEHGKAVAAGLLQQFGFSQFKFQPDDKRSKYYTPDTQIEVYGYHPALKGSNTKYKDGWVEIATFGIYSATALSQYDIPCPVMNLGLGVERLAMILCEAKDMRDMVYPQFKEEWVMTDAEIAHMISIEKHPQTKGRPRYRHGDHRHRRAQWLCAEPLQVRGLVGHRQREEAPRGHRGERGEQEAVRRRFPERGVRLQERFAGHPPEQPQVYGSPGKGRARRHHGTSTRLPMLRRGTSRKAFTIRPSRCPGHPGTCT